MAIDFNSAGPQPLFEDADARKARLETALRGNIKSLVRHLYPKAEIGPKDARVGDTSGARGHSLSIALTPNEAGMWIDHATGDKGDVFELIMRSLSCSFQDALSEAEAFTGGRVTQRQVMHKAEQAAKPDAGKPAIIDTIDYVYKSREGRRIATVYRHTLENGKKTFAVHRASDGTYSAPDPRPLYRLPDIVTADRIVFVEGEKCADALASVGVTATTAMMGSNTATDKVDWTPLAGKHVTIWPDNDEPGFVYSAEVRRILEGMGCTVRVVIIPEGKPSKWDAADAVESGEDVRAYLGEAQPFQTRKLPILSVADLADLEPPNWLIDGMLVENGFSAFYAPSETFKSFIALDIALSISTGQDWRGKPTVAGPVVYMIGEGVAGWPGRVFTWLKHRGNGADAQFWTIPTSIALTEAGDAEALLAAVQSACERPAMIIIDTLARNFGGGDENSTQDMNLFVTACDRIREATGAHVMLIHHTGKDAEKGGRGSSVLRAALDTEMQSHRPNMDGHMVEFKITKQKDIEKGQPIHFEMVQVEAVHPRTGEVISSLIPVLREVAEVDMDAMRTIDREIIVALNARPQTIKELMEVIPRDRTVINRALTKMEAEKIVFADRGEKAVVWACVQACVQTKHQSNQGEE